MPLLIGLIDLYSLIVVAAAIVSWIPLDRRHPVAAFVYRVTEPVLAPIRRALPPIGGLDFSPMVLLIALQVLKSILL